MSELERERMRFLNSLMHRAARRDKANKRTALEWLHILLQILASNGVQYMIKTLYYLCRLLHRLQLKVIQYVIKTLEWLKRDARKEDEEYVTKLSEWLQQSNPLDLSLTLTPQKNTALHIAVRFNQQELAREILKLCPCLVSQCNSKGDNPLHIAAKAGHPTLMQLLVDAAQVARGLEEGSQGTPLNPAVEELKIRNLEGNTVFHESLKNRNGGVAMYLLDLYEELGRVVNGVGESPLYLAAEAGLIHVVRRLIAGKDYSVEGPDGQTPLHIAVIKGHSETVDILQNCGCRDAEQVDRLGNTALHYAAALGYGEIIVNLVSATPSLVYVIDNNGNSPLHIMAKRGSRLHIRMAEYILYTNPCAAEQVDRKGRNALHLAAMNGNLSILTCLLKQPELNVLINEPDDDGNTPLHLAVKIHDFRIVMILLNMGADSGVTNKEGVTALDMNEFDRGFSIRKLLIHDILKFFGAPKGRLAWVERIQSGVRDIADLRSLAETMSIVAALLATVTFTALFTVPGGYKNDGPEEGLPVFIRKFALKAFLMSDIVAFGASLLVAFPLIWAMMGDRALMAVILRWSARFCWVAGPATVAALSTAMYLVLADKCLWLAIIVMFILSVGPFAVYLWFVYCATTTPRSVAYTGGTTKGLGLGLGMEVPFNLKAPTLGY